MYALLLCLFIFNKQLSGGDQPFRQGRVQRSDSYVSSSDNHLYFGIVYLTCVASMVATALNGWSKRVFTRCLLVSSLIIIVYVLVFRLTEGDGAVDGEGDSYDLLKNEAAVSGVWVWVWVCVCVVVVVVVFDERGACR